MSLLKVKSEVSSTLGQSEYMVEPEFRKLWLQNNFFPHPKTWQIVQYNDQEHRLWVSWVERLTLPFSTYVTLNKSYLISLSLGLLIYKIDSKSVS